MNFWPLLAGALAASLFLPMVAARGTGEVFLTKFLAANNGPVADEDGEDPN